ncbi:hypothetical protein Plec18167_002177 [Paecilomyces lecythidis]|uniref:DUF7492 domain-containing protein n=1 Tax=Paecilomyces lecythidis TaxID=3004212 RepID=A0ABR3Y9P2_9EURO
MSAVSKLVLTAVLCFSFIATTIDAHSWVEQLMVIAPNGTFTGSPGYARGNVLRTAPGFSDPTMVYLLPPDGRANVIYPTDPMCKDTQRTQNQTAGSPRLQAAPGAAIALRFQENGHVTLPWNQPGKPENRGTLYVYGTTQPRENDTFLGIHKVWNRNGTGGDKRGVLLSVQNFDDGRCYQINSGNISTHRQTVYPHQANQLMGADLWCQQDIALPSDAPTGKPYTLYWVWDWPTLPNIDPSLPKGKLEMYTTCMDIDVVESPKVHNKMLASYAKDQSLNEAAIPGQFSEVFGGHQSQVPATLGSNSTVTSATVSPPTEQSSAITSTPSSAEIPQQSFVTVTKTVTESVCTQTPEAKPKRDLGEEDVELTVPFYKSPRQASRIGRRPAAHRRNS